MGPHHSPNYVNQHVTSDVILHGANVTFQDLRPLTYKMRGLGPVISKGNCSSKNGVTMFHSKIPNPERLIWDPSQSWMWVLAINLFLSGQISQVRPVGQRCTISLPNSSEGAYNSVTIISECLWIFTFRA